MIHAYGREIRVGLVPGAEGRTIALSIPAGQNRAEARLDPAVALLLADALRSLAG